MTPDRVEKLKKLLPSKKFTKIVGICGGIVLVFFIATSFFGSRSIFGTQSYIPLQEGDTLGDVMDRDSNSNGITDWEESLWGLDPKGDGISNKKIIDDKKVAAGIDITSEASTDESLTPTDQFAQEFLASILALHQSGSLTTDAVGQVAESIGKHIDSKRVVKPAYTSADQTIVSTDPTKAKNAYKISLKKLVDQYQNLGIGTELDIMGKNLVGGDETALAPLGPIATAYTDFSKKLIALPVPKAAAPYALSLANSSAQMGIALVATSHIYSDVLSGMIGVDDYVKGSDVFDQSIRNFADYFGN